ncbi:MAG TPA: hypothetical protein VHI52_19790, partial [Verrucomicrobiae bacterium]|nr:hypothetical protein [Verrucomicrobiae bacterium]
GTDEAWFSKPFKTRMIRDAEWFSSAMFFLSGCLEQMRTLQQRREPLIIMDRSVWSTLAVHAAQDADRLLRLIEMLKPIASEIRAPHLTLVLEASFATCQERIGRKQGEALALDRLTANEEFHGREKEFYRWLATQVPSVAFLDVNGDAPKELARKTIELCHLRRC